MIRFWDSKLTGAPPLLSAGVRRLESEVAAEAFREPRRSNVMATAGTALRMMREICLSLPETVESEHFGEACFRIGNRIFASCGQKDGLCRLVLQLEPEHANQLVTADPRFQPYARQRHCVWMDAAGVEDWDEVRSLVLESYRLNAPGNRPPKRASATARKKRPKTNR